MAFEAQIANLRDQRHRSLTLDRTADFAPTTRIEIVGELNERSCRLAAERIDSELADNGAAILVSLDRVTRTQWSALCRLMTKIQSVRARGLDVRIARPKPTIRMLLATIALGDSLAFEATCPVAARSVIIA